MKRIYKKPVKVRVVFSDENLHPQDLDRTLKRCERKFSHRFNKFKGYTLKDCDCRYCLYYSGIRKGKVTCLADECVCADEIRQAKERSRKERRKSGSKD